MLGRRPARRRRSRRRRHGPDQVRQLDRPVGAAEDAQLDAVHLEPRPAGNGRRASGTARSRAGRRRPSARGPPCRAASRSPGWSGESRPAGRRRRPSRATRRPLRDSSRATICRRAQPVGAIRTMRSQSNGGSRDQPAENPHVPAPSAKRHGNPSPFLARGRLRPCPVPVSPGTCGPYPRAAIPRKKSISRSATPDPGLGPARSARPDPVIPAPPANKGPGSIVMRGDGPICLVPSAHVPIVEPGGRLCYS